MTRQISRAEAWERAHEVFTQINFNAFDYNTIKDSLVDYMKLYYPEDFNDYIESSEFVAIMELFAYVGGLVAYRLDLNAHENFITTAERKESVLRLAKLISYKASRNIPSRGLVKLTSVQTTETLFDSSGRNISGRKILWNDNNNADWKEQFLLVVNRVLEQPFGSVSPNERVQVDDVLFELYTLNNNPLNVNGKSVFPFTATVNGQTLPMELVPTELTSTGPTEKRPEVNGKFALLYASDGLGDASDTTGFLVYTKQGTLQKQQTTFDGITPNQTLDLGIDNINETDLWLNNVDPNSRQIIVTNPYSTVLPHLSDDAARYGEWFEVDLSNAQNILFNTSRERRKYETETLDADNVRLIFGDGEFADIPSGAFDIWFRVSANSDVAIPRSTVVNQLATFTYNDAIGNVQTFTFQFSLISSLLNASPSEDIEHIRRVAPSVYYTQDRMVNGRDYNSFPLQDPTILKLRSINRTFAGDSKYIAWHDPREYYENVKMFGDDLALYWVEKEPSEGGTITVNSFISATDLISTYVEPLLCSVDLYNVLASRFSGPTFSNPINVRCQFNDEPYSFSITPSTELACILDRVSDTNFETTDLYYSPSQDEWIPSNTSNPPAGAPSDVIWMIRIRKSYSGSSPQGWIVTWRTRRLIAQSVETQFWNTNGANTVIDFDTLASVRDYIAVLKANVNSEGTSVLDNNINLLALSQELVDESSLPNVGLPDIHRLNVESTDDNEDGIPDNVALPELFNKVTINPLTFAATMDVTLDRSIIVDPSYTLDELNIYLLDADGTIVYTVPHGNGTGEWSEQLPIDADLPDGLTDNIRILAPSGGSPSYASVVTQIRIDYIDHVYLHRISNQDPYEPMETTDEAKVLWAIDNQITVEADRHYIRYAGRYPFNFAWFHFTPRLNLVDPAASNIIDMFIVTRGYYLALRRWIEGRSDDEPTAQTPLELRNTYGNLIDNKMISDTVILHPGEFKILFGPKAIPQLRARFEVIRPADGGNLTDNEVKVQIVNVIRNFFTLEDWEFGETFFYSELNASIHAVLGPEIKSVVIVPLYSSNQFGDMFQIMATEDELFIPDIQTTDIEIVASYTPTNIRQEPE
jgi:hypothetical protein